MQTLQVGKEYLDQQHFDQWKPDISWKTHDLKSENSKINK